MQPLIQTNTPTNKKTGLKVFALVTIAVIGTIAACYSSSMAPAHLQAVSLSEDAQLNLFQQWMLEFGKTYESLEVEQFRFQIFKKNLEIVTTTNAKNLPYTLAMNQFADLSQEEFGSFFNGFVASERPLNIEILNTDNLPTSVNWTAAGAVTPVKNQGQCGSCWSFSTTGALEGLNFITNKKLLSFSEQQLVDCSYLYGNLGCFGGEMDKAFKYVEAKGIEEESTYPYKGFELGCKYDASKVVFKNKDHKDVQPNSVEQLMAAVAQQPVSIAVEADQATWQLYHSGVVTKDCGQKLDHGVLAVGYGTLNGIDYWQVKNSWGEKWGMEGYILIERSDANLCGVLSQPSYPTM